MKDADWLQSYQDVQGTYVDITRHLHFSKLLFGSSDEHTLRTKFGSNSSVLASTNGQMDRPV